MSSASPSLGARLPAVLFCEEPTGSLRVAALTLLDRLVVAAHRAGCGPITVVCGGALPDVRRSRAWGIGIEVATAPPVLSGPVLVATTGMLVQAADLRRVIERGGRLVDRAGYALPGGVLPRGSVAEAVLSEALGKLEGVEAEGASCRVTDAVSAVAAERRLWASLTSSSDGWVDRHFNRPVGRLLFRWLIWTPVSPNAISIMSVLVGLAAAGLMAVGEWGWVVAGAVLFQVSAIIDCVDGDVARAVFKESPLGKWIDLVGDQVVHAGVFLGIAVGLLRGGSEAPVLWLGASAVCGAVLSFLVVLRGMRTSGGGGGAGMTQRIVDAATNRDFSVLVLGLALVGSLEWFLWMAAVGSHVFWVVALVLQGSKRPVGGAGVEGR